VHEPVVRVTSRRAPSIRWSCPSCRSAQPFDCSERFRANARGSLIDIWLIYRCRRCDATKNLTVLERTPVAKIPRAVLDAAHRNDASVARSIARDLGLLRRNGAAIAEGDDWRIDSTATSHAVLELPEPLLIRLDAVLAAAFGLPRSKLPPGTLTVDRAGRLDRLRLWDGLIHADFAATVDVPAPYCAVTQAAQRSPHGRAHRPGTIRPDS
jgi:hypothetical protein